MGDDPVVPRVGAGDDSAPVRVFVSYRRADDRHFVGRLHDRLCDAFGGDSVFRDIDSIQPGTHFRDVILRTLSDVDAVVAIIGPNWSRPETGAPPVSDYVFMELAEALKHGTPVIPALVEETAMPSPEVLPADVRPITDIHAVSIHADPSFRHDSARLVEVVREVVSANRRRIADDRQAADARAREADERARAAAAEQRERSRRLDELRAEERAARARLAELEEAATRRQIELERVRLEAIAEQLRLAEAPDRVSLSAPGGEADRTSLSEALEAPIRTSLSGAVEEPAMASEGPVAVLPVEAFSAAPASVIEAVPADAVENLTEAGPETDSQSASETGPDAAPSPSRTAGPPEDSLGSAFAADPERRRRHLAHRVLPAFIATALVLGLVAVFVNRGVYSSFNELSSGRVVDVTAWVMTLAVGLPLLLGARPVEQRFVLAGVAISAFLFGFLHSSAVIRYGSDGLNEGRWILLKLLQAACLVVALRIVRGRTSRSVIQPWVSVALLVLSGLSAVLLVGAVYSQWSDTKSLVENGYLPGRTSVVIWMVLLAAAPIAVTVRLAIRSTQGARLTLAIVATLATFVYVAQADFLHREFDVDGSGWTRAALASAPLALLAWWSALRGTRYAEGGIDRTDEPLNG